MNTYEHSVYLDEKKCSGCTACLKHCPTEAIRIRGGRAVINNSRCIDCGECIRTCPQGAKKAVCEKLSAMDKFKLRYIPVFHLIQHTDNIFYSVRRKVAFVKYRGCLAACCRPSDTYHSRI